MFEPIFRFSCTQVRYYNHQMVGGGSEHKEKGTVVLSTTLTSIQGSCQPSIEVYYSIIQHFYAYILGEFRYMG